MVDRLDDKEEHDKSDNKEADNRVQEFAEAERRPMEGFVVSAEIYLPKHADKRRDDVFDQCLYDLAERTANDYSDGQIDHIAPQDKLSEIFR